MNSHGLSTWTTIVKPPKAEPKVQRKNEHPTFISYSKEPFNLTAKILSCIKKKLMKKNDSLSTIV
jgi:hypothetical protein